MPRQLDLQDHGTEAILVINTGGTFNKRYDEVTGELKVPADEQAVDAVLATFRDNHHIRLLGLIHKDSLELTPKDREQLAETINAAAEDRILLVHGTDTMDATARFLAAHCPAKRIVLTGAMKPFELDPLEAGSNFALAFGFLNADAEPGLFIAMHGLALPHERISKDRQQGIFRRSPGA